MQRQGFPRARETRAPMVRPALCPTRSHPRRTTPRPASCRRRRTCAARRKAAPTSETLRNPTSRRQPTRLRSRPSMRPHSRQYTRRRQRRWRWGWSRWRRSTPSAAAAGCGSWPWRGRQRPSTGFWAVPRWHRRQTAWRPPAARRYLPPRRRCWAGSRPHHLPQSFATKRHPQDRPARAAVAATRWNRAPVWCPRRTTSAGSMAVPMARSASASVAAVLSERCWYRSERC
mmetsp:Transcript_36357/g.92895  ORF Transcript_36357/g.92895 Transcript_36357/m.92895 type:complete len:230 (-) Transcript_36357:160-849(-)